MRRCPRCGGAAAALLCSIKDPKTGKRRMLCGICDLELHDDEPNADDQEGPYAEWEPGEP